MAHSPRRRALSEATHARPGLTGLGIEFFSVHDTDAHKTPSSASHTTKTIPSTAFPLSSTRRFEPNLVHQVAHMRSMKGMEGLKDAEFGGSMVEFNPFACEGGSGFKAGQKIGPAPIMSLESNRTIAIRSRAATVCGASLTRSGTFFSLDATTSRKSTELKTLLGGSGRKASAKSIIMPADSNSLRPIRSTSDFAKLSRSSSVDVSNVVSLEKAKTRTRVEVDIELESDVIVEGGHLRGRMQVCIRSATRHEPPIWIGGGKLRIVGFEGLPTGDTRYMFYQHSALLDNITAASHILFTSEPDHTGFCRAREGTHILPFSMSIPIRGPGGCPKGTFHGRNGPSIRYIVMGSLKIKEGSAPLSVAHFYRHIEVFPFLGFDVLLPASQPVQASTSQSIFLGGSGKLKMSVSLHRQVWVAGQSCSVRVMLDNHTTKTVKSLTFTIIRTTTFFKPKVELDALEVNSPMSADMDACQTNTNRKEVAQVVLEMGQKGEKGVVTAKGFWTGVDAERRAQISKLVLIPADALSIPRGRLVEVNYHLKVSASFGVLTTVVNVAVPLRIINFLSIDPAPDFSSCDPGYTDADLVLPQGIDHQLSLDMTPQNKPENLVEEPPRMLRRSPSLLGHEMHYFSEGMPDSTSDATTSSFLRAFPPRKGARLLSTMEARSLRDNLIQNSSEELPHSNPVPQAAPRSRTVAFKDLHSVGPEDMNNHPAQTPTQDPAQSSQITGEPKSQGCDDAALNTIALIPSTNRVGANLEPANDEEHEHGANDKAKAEATPLRNNPATSLLPTSLMGGEVLHISNSRQGALVNRTHRYDLHHGRIPDLPMLSASKSLHLADQGGSSRASLLDRSTGKPTASNQLTKCMDDLGLSPRRCSMELAQTESLDGANRPVLAHGSNTPNSIHLCPIRQTHSSLGSRHQPTLPETSASQLPFRPVMQSRVLQAQSLSQSDSSGLGSRSSRWSSSTTNSSLTNGTNLARQSSDSSFSDSASSVRVKVAQFEARRALGSTESSPMLPVYCHFVPLVRSNTFQITRGEGSRPRIQDKIRLVAQRPRNPERLVKDALTRS